MMFGRRTLAVWALTALSDVTAAGAGAQVAEIADTTGPTAIEQALIEHSCGETTAASATGADPYKECLGSQLRALRTDFGRDLSRVSASERRTLDSVCNGVRASGREAYLDCVRDHLVSLGDRRRRADRALLVVPPLPDQLTGAVPAAPAAERSSWVPGLWVGVGVLTLVVAGGGAFLTARSRRPVVRKCRACGNDVAGSGDLCPACRHEAAEALRHAAIERAQHQRSHEEAQRQLKALEEEQKAEENEKEARRRQEEARRLEEDAARRRKEEEELRQRHRAAAAPATDDEVFDPYAILGVSRDATIEAIDAAYQEARSKYSPDHVAHLGAELQEHFRRKAEAVDRAYLMLIA